MLYLSVKKRLSRDRHGHLQENLYFQKKCKLKHFQALMNTQLFKVLIFWDDHKNKKSEKKITHFHFEVSKGTFINDVPRFLAFFYLPTYLVLLYNVRFFGLSWAYGLPTLISDVINGRSPRLAREYFPIQTRKEKLVLTKCHFCLLYTSPSPRD